MPVSDFQTHPVFRRGVSPKIRLLIYVTICVVVLVGDLRFLCMDSLRGYLHEVTSPMRAITSESTKLLSNASDHFSNLTYLQTKNIELEQYKIDSAERLQFLDALEQENADLRKLLGMRKKMQVTSYVAEVLYSAPDSSSRKIVIDRGKEDKIIHGLAVADADGLIGQVTRVYPSQSEVTLITDRNQAVPVHVLRNGLRGVMFGAGQGLRTLSEVPKRWQQAVQSDVGPGSLELRFVLFNADIQPKDRLVTSGLDGTFPAGLPVAEVESVNREAGDFAHITCRPLGGVEKSSKVLVLGRKELPPPPPKPETGDPPPPPLQDSPRAVRRHERGG